MGIVLAVKKNSSICIASDTMTISGGSRKQTAAHVLGPEKVVKWGSSYIGITTHPSWLMVLKNYIKTRKQKPAMSSREEIFGALLEMHGVLKDKYYLSPHTDDDDDPFESSRFESIVVNSHGIFKTYELRSVQQFIHFTAIGSGSQYALGAMQAVYNQLDSAEDIARIALNAAAEFDDSSGLPGIFHTVQLLK